MGGNRTAGALLLCALLACALGGATSASPDLPTDMLQQAAASLACVESTLPARDGPGSHEGSDGPFRNVGFFVGPDGEMLTSLLGVAGCSEIKVVCPDGRSAPARIFAVDQPSGLALLKTDLPDTATYEPATEAPLPGEWVLLANTRPQGEGVTATLSPGIVKRRGASLQLQGVSWDELSAVSMNVWPGCAAAPVLDMKGRLAGIVLGVATGPDGPAGEPDCYVLPVAQLLPIIERLKRGESRRLGWMGIWLSARPEDRQGARVLAVLESSPAQAAGLRPGDVILRVDERVVDDPAVLARYIVQASPDRTVAVTVLRDGEVFELPVEVGPRPLLICCGAPWPGGKVLPGRRPCASTLLPGPGSSSALAGLREENEHLRARIRELEGE